MVEYHFYQNQNDSHNPLTEENLQSLTVDTNIFSLSSSESVTSLTEKLKTISNLFEKKNEILNQQQKIINQLQKKIEQTENQPSETIVTEKSKDSNKIDKEIQKKMEDGRWKKRYYIPVSEVNKLSSYERDFNHPDLSDWKNKNNHKKITVLTWDYNRGGGWAYLGANPLQLPNYLGQEVKKTCPVNCEITGDKKDLGRSHAVVFEAQSHQGHDWQRDPIEFPLKKRNQKWVNFGYEQYHYFPLQIQRPWQIMMDMNMTFQEQDDVQVTFTCNWGGGELSDYLRPPKPKKRLMAAIISNCGGGGAFGRIRYLRELMEYLEIDSYGRCEHNIDLPKEMQGEVYANHGKAMRNKVKLFEDYKFVLAFENNNVTDYITEKIYNVFQAGSIPIYMGSSTIDDWVPGEHSMIRTDHYSGPKELAEYILKLDQDDDLYNEYFEWKKKGILNTFIDKYKKCVFYNSECRLCQHIADSIQPSDFKVDENEPYRCLSMKADSWAEFPSSPLYDLQDEYTLAAWIYANDLNDRRIIDKNPSGVVKGYNFDTIHTKKGQPILRLCAGQACFYSVHTLEIKTWLHVAVTFSSSLGQVCIFINGWKDSCNLHGTPTEINTNRLHIGATQGSEHNRWDGMLDEVMIWNIALPPEEMERLPFSQYEGTKEPHLVAYFKFDQERGQQVVDSSMYSNHGVLGGGASYSKSSTKPMRYVKWNY